MIGCGVDGGGVSLVSRLEVFIHCGRGKIGGNGGKKKGCGQMKSNIFFLIYKSKCKHRTSRDLFSISH